MILVMVCSRCPLEPVQAAPSLASARWSSPCYLFLLCHLTNVAVVLARQLPDPARAAADQCREGAVALSCRPGASRLATWLPEPARAQSTNWLSTFPHVCAVCPRPCPGCSRWSSNGSSAAHWVCAEEHMWAARQRLPGTVRLAVQLHSTQSPPTWASAPL